MPQIGLSRVWVLRPSVATRDSPVVLTWDYDVAKRNKLQANCNGHSK